MREFFDPVNHVISSVSLLLNIILLPIILFRSSKEIGTYKYLLALYTFIAGLFSLANVTLAPLFISSELCWLVLGTGFLKVPQQLGGILLTIYCTCYAALLQSLVFSYLYRYIYVCKPEWRNWFSVPWKVAALISTHVIIVLHWGLASFFTMRPTAETNALYNKTILKYMGQSSQNVAYIGHTAYLDGHYETTMIVIVAERFVFIVISNVVINKFAFSVVKQFKHDMSMISKSTKLYAMQRRLFTLLRLQTFSPILTTYIPALSSIALTYLGVESETYAMCVSFLMCIGTGLDPILIIVMVTEYRKFIVSWFYCGRKPVQVKEVSSNGLG